MVHRPSERDVFPAQIARYIDVAAYVLDARAPSACVWIDDKLIGRECFLLSRMDLADGRITARWQKYFEDAGYPAFPVNSVSGEGVTPFLEFLERVYSAKASERELRGIEKTVLRLVVLGVPNVGKSTLLNAILGRRKVRVGAAPGITRGYQWVRVMDGVDLLDTPGIIRDTAHFKKHRPTWISLNLMESEEPQLEFAVRSLLDALPARARKRVEKYYKHEMPWDGSTEEFAIKVAMIKRFFLGKGLPDLPRSYRVILRDFQRGRFGRVSLETPETHPVSSPFFKAKEDAEE